MPDCVFCHILNEVAPASFVYRDSVCSAFMDIQPVNAGHLLVIPNAHLASLADLDDDTTGHLMRVARRLVIAVRAAGGFRCEGVNLFVADGEVAGQEVFHVHLHVIPRYRGDGFGLQFGPHYLELPPRGELERAAAQIRSALAP